MRLGLLLLIGLSASAQESSNHALAWSMVAMSAASAADAYTSWHRPEANALLRNERGEFGAKGISVKVGTLAGIVMMEYRLRKHREMRNAFVVGNCANAGVSTFAAVHNWRLR